MPRFSTSPSSGSGDDDQGSPMRLTYNRGEAAEHIDGMADDEEPEPPAVRSDLAESGSQGSHSDEIPNERAVEKGVKRKRGRPPKSATKPQARGNSSKDNPKAQRRSSRIVAKGKSKVEEGPAQGATGRLKRRPASMTSQTREQKGKGNVTSSKAVRATQEKEWDVEEIVGTHIDNTSSATLYLVKWKGYPAKENTWEPKENLGNCKSAIKKFEAKQKEARKKPAAKKPRTMKG